MPEATFTSVRGTHALTVDWYGSIITIGIEHREDKIEMHVSHQQARLIAECLLKAIEAPHTSGHSGAGAGEDGA